MTNTCGAPSARGGACPPSPLCQGAQGNRQGAAVYGNPTGLKDDAAASVLDESTACGKGYAGLLSQGVDRQTQDPSSGCSAVTPKGHQSHQR